MGRGGGGGHLAYSTLCHRPTEWRGDRELVKLPAVLDSVCSADKTVRDGI